MTPEQLKRGKEIEQEIRDVKVSLEEFRSRYKDARKDDYLYLTQYRDGSGWKLDVGSAKGISAEVLEFAIDRMEEQIVHLEAEFAEL